MESLFIKIAESGEILFQAIWLPVLIWSIIGSATWLILNSSKQIHPEYQYHGRLALVFSLPVGFVFLFITEKLSAWAASTAAGSGYRLLTFTAPFEVTVIPGQESAGVSIISILYAVLLLVLITGIITALANFIYQCMHLRNLRSRFTLFDIHHVEQLNEVNTELANAAGKSVKVAFLSSEIVPVTFGIRQPVILLPESLLHTPRKLNLVLRHELTHIRQNDFFTQLLIYITKALFWFHPLMHRLSKELVEYREMRCDYRVLHEKSVSRKEYAMLLLELIPMPNIDKNLSVNMAQESSNLKKRITMITQQSHKKPIPVKSSLALLGSILLSTAIIMACTDMQTQDVFDEEELNIMTDMDQTGDRGHHQVIIYMGDEEQAERHSEALDQLRTLEPEHIQSIDVVRGADAVEQYGERASNGVIVVRTKLEWESYSTTLETLGLNPQSPPSPPSPPEPDAENEDHFMVVEEMPELIGGLTGLMQEISYPEEAREAEMEGRVFVQFIVDENGDVLNPQIIRSAGDPLDEEALRVVEQAKFKPGMQRGEPVKVQYSLPISFRLQESDSNRE